MIAPDEQQSHRFAVEGRDPNGGARTVIGWAQPMYLHGAAGGARAVVVAVDTTPRTAVLLDERAALALADAIRAAVSR